MRLNFYRNGRRTSCQLSAHLIDTWILARDDLNGKTYRESYYCLAEMASTVDPQDGETFVSALERVMLSHIREKLCSLD